MSRRNQHLCIADSIRARHQAMLCAVDSDCARGGGRWIDGHGEADQDSGCDGGVMGVERWLEHRQVRGTRTGCHSQQAEQN